MNAPGDGLPATIDEAVHELVLMVAQYTIELLADEYGASDAYGDRVTLAQEIAETTAECAREMPDHEVNRLRAVARRVFTEDVAAAIRAEYREEVGP